VASDPIFTDGALVANRFHIVRFLGRGGVGEVYEAEDQELGGRVALKTLRRDTAPEARALDRFRREVRLARRVTHPNVCRLFDVFHHQFASHLAGSESSVSFVTMELLAGSSLADYLHRKGRLTTAEALPIVEQIAAGLDSAHRAGIVHRDFKSANVMLVPDQDGGMRAVVTDFGFAHAASDDDLAVTATASGGIWGTPAYLAPEQVEGGAVTFATDIYALGMVLYEMVTGARPFDAETPLATAVKRLQQPAVSPALLVPDLDERWESTILRCLEREPARRFASARDVVAALRGELDAGIALPRPRRGAPVWIIGAVLVLVLGAAIAGVWLNRPSTNRAANDLPTAATVAPRRSVAVLGFRNLSGSADVSWMSIAFAEILSAELAAGEQLRVLPGETVARVKTDLALGDAESYAADTLQRIRTVLGTDAVVLGSYLVVGDAAARRIRVDVRAQDATTGETIAVVTDAGPDSELLDLVARAGAEVRARLGMRTLSKSEAEAVRAAVPTTTEAAQFYAEGLTRLRRFEALPARDLLEKAVAADPPHSLAYAALAAAWTALGYTANAQQAAKRAVDLSSRLSRADQLWVEGRYREALRDWPKAIETYKTLFGFFPDNVDYGLQLAGAQVAGGQGQAALGTLDSLRSLPSPFRDDTRIDLAEAAAAIAITDFKRAHVAALNARAKAAEQGTRLLAARARLDEGWALWNLGQPKDAIAATDEARRFYNEGGDRAGAARASVNMAIIYARQDDVDRAKQLYQESLTTNREIGNEGGVGFALNNLANLLADQRQYAEARRAYDEALAVNRKVGNKNAEAGVLGNIANLLQYDGKLAESRRMHEASLVVLRELGARMNIAIELTNLASVLVDQGDLGEARKLLDEALDIKRQVGSRSSIAFTLTTLSDALLAQGDFDGARKAGEEARNLREQLGEKGLTAESQLQLAQIALDAGNAAQAEAEAKTLVDTFRALDNIDGEANASGVWALAALAQGRVDAARSAIERATTLLPRITTRSVRLRAVVARVQVDGAAGRTDAALRDGANAIIEAERFELGIVAAEARLAAARVELAINPEQARGKLQALEREAARKGFGLIVHRIRALSPRA
jgi:tetratricopeptide (TPR) repeat protein/tRNA A-37 threonylcarbamoyl transferase component Bud32/TolB-like protein